MWYSRLRAVSDFTRWHEGEKVQVAGSYLGCKLILPYPPLPLTKYSGTNAKRVKYAASCTATSQTLLPK